MTVRYRHIFFKDNIMSSGNGTIDVEFYGNMYSQAMKMKNFRDMFDNKLDLFVACNDCARSKYHSFKKVRPNS